MVETFVIHMGRIHKLDVALAEAQEKRTILIAGTQQPAAHREMAPLALLAASAESTDHGYGFNVYLIIGALDDARLSEDRKHVTFAALRRYVVPIAISSSTGPLRVDMPGSPVYWSPSAFYWLPDRLG